MEHEILHLSEIIQEDHLFNLMDELEVGIYLFDLTGNTLFANSHFHTMFGYTEEEIQTKTVYDLFDPQDVHFIIEEYATQKANINYHVKGKKRDQSRIDLQLISQTKHDDASIMVTFLDAAQQKTPFSKKLIKLEKLNYALAQTAAVSSSDRDGNIIYVNDRFCEVSKYSREELLGQNHRIIKSGHHSKEFFEELWATITKGEIWRNETCNKAKDGSIWWGSATIVPLLDENGEPYQYIGIRQDVTNLKITEEKHYRMAYYDFLTKLPNRRLFEAQLEHEFAEAQEKVNTFSLMIIDLHGLKFVNDSLGTEIGDMLLQRAAIRLTQSAYPKGFLSRIDGNEFAIIFPNMPESDLIKAANGILMLFSHPFTIGEYELFLSASIGMSIFPDGGNGIHRLVKNASFAMHQSKTAGKNGYQLFSHGMHNCSDKILMLKNDLRKALKNDEFFLYYQPRIDPMSDKIIGAEALIRWGHPKLGIISPVEFIPMAEEEGLIGKIGEWVLYNACRQNKIWQDAGLPPIIVSVNFSVIQFLQSDMIQEVDRVLQETGLEAKYLEIEITETALMKDEAAVSSKIERLKSMGIKTAIDDFGTGYASLSYLKNLKTNTLKIDSSFIEGIPVESVSSEIVTSIIHLARKLNIRTVAEGVENIEQLRLLKEIHCDEIQGYLYSKPVSIQEFEPLLKREIFSPK